MVVSVRVILDNPEDLARRSELLRLYRDEFGSSAALCFEGFDEEIAALPAEQASPLGAFLLASSVGEISGACALHRISSSECELRRLYVLPSHRGSGVGKVLVAKSIELAKSLGVTVIRLEVADAMATAATLYRSFGFVRVGYSDGIERMALRLN